MKRRTHKRMYAVSKPGIGIVAGTMCYSRRESIRRFLCEELTTWEIFKHAGYRTVMAQIKIVHREVRP